MADETSYTQAAADRDPGEAGGGLGVARKRVLTFLKRHDQLVGKFLPQLLEAMTPVDQKSSKVLLKRLSSSVAEGEAPSFADAGARSGYTRRRMKHRSAQIGIVLMHPLLARVAAKLSQKERGGAFNAASIGGGPGSDAVGLLSSRDFLAGSCGINCGVWDFEPGWGEGVLRIEGALTKAGLAPNSADSVSFGTCDVTVGLDVAANRALREAAAGLDLVVFSFVLVENAKALQEGGFAVLQGLLGVLPQRAVVLVLDNSYLLFAAIGEVARTAGWEHETVSWPRDINGHTKNVLAISHPSAAASEPLVDQGLPPGFKDTKNVLATSHPESSGDVTPAATAPDPVGTVVDHSLPLDVQDSIAETTPP